MKDGYRYVPPILRLSLMKVDLSRIKPNKAARQPLSTNTKDPMSDTRLMLTLSI